jgi:phosphatidylserine/phosphatidylglycerophosphate/cardiolipin synthase-like enzyme
MKKIIPIIFLIFLFLSKNTYPITASLYFTPDKRSEQIIKDLIMCAEESIYIAGYSFTWTLLSNELGKKKGLDIKVMLDTFPPFDLKNIEIKVDKRSALFHPKFIIVDGKRILFGSGNFTESSFRVHHNNFLLFTDEKIGIFLTKKFLSWWNEEKIDDEYNDKTVRILFSPENDCEKIISEEIKLAKESICFALYHFTSKELAKSMIRRNLAGVKVNGMIENVSVEPHSVFNGLKGFGCNVRRSNRAGFLHDKFIIIDREVVITGSYNLTASARRNNESVMIIRDKNLASKFMKEWLKMWRFYSLP